MGFLVGASLVFGACPGAPTQAQEEKAAVVVEEKVMAQEVVPVKDVPPSTPQVEVKPAGLAAARFMFVFRGEVALEPAAEEAWGTGKVKFKKTKEGLEGRRDVDMAKLPEAIKQLDGAAVTLYGARGEVCEAIIKGMTIYGVSERGDEEESEGELPSMPVLMAGLADKKGPCAGALWARRSDAPAPVVYAAKKVDAAMLARVRAATEKLTAYAAMATAYGEYARDTGDKLTWDKFAAKQLRAELWSEVGGARELVVVQVGDPESVRCEANFSESLAAVFAIEGQELRVVTESGPWQPTALFDADGDGAVEVLVTPPGGIGGILMAAARKEGEVLKELRFPSEGLGCGGDGMDDEP